jgi:hypothetical protein
VFDVGGPGSGGRLLGRAGAFVAVGSSGGCLAGAVPSSPRGREAERVTRTDFAGGVGITAPSGWSPPAVLARGVHVQFPLKKRCRMAMYEAHEPSPLASPLLRLHRGV